MAGCRAACLFIAAAICFLSAAGAVQGAADFNDDGDQDILIFYDYGNGTSGVWAMLNNGSGFDDPTRVWVSGRGNWEAPRSNLIAP